MASVTILPALTRLGRCGRATKCLSLRYACRVLISSRSIGCDGVKQGKWVSLILNVSYVGDKVALATLLAYLKTRKSGMRTTLEQAVINRCVLQGKVAGGRFDGVSLKGADYKHYYDYHCVTSAVVAHKRNDLWNQVDLGPFGWLRPLLFQKACWMKNQYVIDALEKRDDLSVMDRVLGALALVDLTRCSRPGGQERQYAIDGEP